MRLQIERIHEYAGENLAERKYVEGQHVLWSNFVVKCGSLQDKESGDSNLTKIHSECIQSCHISDQRPFIVTGVIQKDGKLCDFVCSCPAGDSGQCKHIIATILYCYFKQEDLPVLSSTDVSCSWSKLRTQILENFKPMPIENHPCFYEQVSTEVKKNKKVFRRPGRTKKTSTNSLDKTKKVLGDSDILNIMEPVNNNNESSASISDISLEPSIDPEEDTSKSESKRSCDETSLDSKSEDSNSFVVRQWKKFKTLPDFSESQLTEMLELRNQLSTSGLVKETLGRHNEITVTEISKVSDYDRKIYKLIFENQKCNLLESIELLQVKPLSMCCQAVITRLDRDPVLICENTRNHFSDWLDERKSRVTGTTGYGLFTYTQNAHTSEDWKKKIESFVAPKDFSTEATEYGRKNEAPAREIFKSQNPNIEVIETGLIICKSLPWIACTPDGVIVHDGKIVSLLEIKCFVNGKSEGIDAVVEKQISKGCLRRRNNVVVMRERNRYYGQVQLGMALLNVESCKFVLYSSFDKNIFVVDVPKDRLFLVKMLRRLKDLYYATILPGICALESDHHTPSSHADERHLIVKYEDTKPQKPKPPVKPKKAMCTSTPKKPKKVIIPLSPRSSKVRI